MAEKNLRRQFEKVRFRLLALAGALLVPKYRFKWPDLNHWQDKGFDTFLEKFDERHGFNSDRRWTVWQLVRLVHAVPGDFAECGVYGGADSWLLVFWAKSHAQDTRTLHLFDSFAGLSEPTPDDGGHWTAGDLTYPMERTRTNLAEFGNVEYHQGWIPERFDEVADKRFAFVHVDVDLRLPTYDSIEFFYPRLSPGGVLVCDDYGFSTCPGATTAIDDFLADKPEKMLSLDGGGGFMIKGTKTSPAVMLPH